MPRFRAYDDLVLPRAQLPVALRALGSTTAPIPALGPPDFHAYVEVLIGGAWYLFDPTGISPITGLIRIGTGRDAADVSFATIFGPVRTGHAHRAVRGDRGSCARVRRTRAHRARGVDRGLIPKSEDCAMAHLRSLRQRLRQGV